MDNQNKDFYEEVDQDVRQEKIAKLFKRYMPHLIVAFIAILIVVGGVTWWKHHQNQKRSEMSDLYLETMKMVENNQTSEAFDKFSQLSSGQNSSAPGYAILSRFQKAYLLIKDAKKGEKPEEGLKAYKEMMTDVNLPIEYQNMARYLYALYSMDFIKNDEKEVLIKELVLLTAPDNPMRGLASELIAHLYYQLGDDNKAKVFCEKVTKDVAFEGSPLFSRCHSLLTILKPKTDDTPPAPKAEAVAAEPKKVVLYTTPDCPFCVKAKKLLDSKGVQYEEIDITDKKDVIEEMIKKADGRKTVPQIFVGEKHIGGFDDLENLEKSKELDGILGKK